jgi:signal transduction histidine kinase
MWRREAVDSVSRRGRAPVVGRRIILAFIALATLALIGGAATAYQIAKEIPETTRLVHRADRVTFLSSDVARHVNSITLRLTRGTDDGVIDSDEAAEVREKLQTLRYDMRQLALLVDSDEVEVFSELDEHMLDFKATANTVLHEHQQGEYARAARTAQTRLLPLREQISPLLDTLVSNNESESLALLRLQEKNENLRTVLWTSAAGTLGFILVLLVAAFHTVRTLRGQQRQIDRQLDQLGRANRDLDHFAARVAHDLRGPLLPILIGAQQLHSLAGDEQRLNVVADRIARSADRANRLIESLLAFSRAGGAPSEARCRADIAALRVLDDYRHEAEADGIELVSEVPRMEVAAAEPLLQQALDNLVGNAIRYIPSDASRRKVTVRGRVVDGRAHLEVADTGPGIPQSERARVFDPFYRVGGSPGSGTGLGLATVQRIVESHDGRIGIDEEDGGGALIWFSIPLASPGPRPADGRPEEAPDSAAA